MYKIKEYIVIDYNAKYYIISKNKYLNSVFSKKHYKFNFYAATTPLLDNMYKIYILSSNNKTVNMGDIICNENNYDDLKKKYKTIDVFYINNKDDIHCRLFCMNIVLSNNIIKSIKWHNNSINSINSINNNSINSINSINNNSINNNSNLSVYVFRQNKKIYKANLSIILWPPAFQFKESITKYIGENYNIIDQTDFTLPSNKLMSFIYSVYKDDIRCNMDNLPRKQKFFLNFPLKLRYIRFLSNNIRLNNDNVSRLAIDLKKKIRTKFKGYIDGYIYDIICHMSDNTFHSNNINKIINKKNYIMEI